MILFAGTEMFYFAAPLFLRGSGYLAAFPPNQLNAFAKLFLSLFAGLSGLSMLYYGTAWLIRGWLSYRSGYLPRFLGVLMVIAGSGFVAKTLTQVLAPAYSSDLLLAPMLLNVLAVGLWMLAKGLDREKWDRATATCPAGGT